MLCTVEQQRDPEFFVHLLQNIGDGCMIWLMKTGYPMP